MLYKLEAIIQSDLDINTLINTIPSYFRCKLYPGDIPNLIHTVVQEWNNYVPFNSTSTNIAHPEQTSLILFPNNDDEADVSKKVVIDMLKKAINNCTDLDFREGTMTYIEKGALKSTICLGLLGTGHSSLRSTSISTAYCSMPVASGGENLL